jgi:hypothetical protein
MQRFVTILAATMMTLAALTVGVETADAGRCNGCERVRRLCLFENKFNYDIEKAVCTGARQSCIAQCEVVFTSNRDIRICSRACKESAVPWRNQFIDALFEGRDACDAADDVCTDRCEDVPREAFTCLRSCSKDILRCAQHAKKAKEICFHACRVSEAPVRDCKRACRVDVLPVHRGCMDDYTSCNDVCLD